MPGGTGGFGPDGMVLFGPGEPAPAGDALFGPDGGGVTGVPGGDGKGDVPGGAEIGPVGRGNGGSVLLGNGDGSPAPLSATELATHNATNGPQ